MASSRDFPGTGTDNIACGSSSGLDSLLNTGGSLAFWAYRTGAGEGNFGRIVGHENTGQNKGFSLYNNSAGTVTWWINFSSLGQWSSASLLPLNTWVFVAATMDASSNSNDPIFYSNGDVASIAEGTTPTGTYQPPTTELFRIGNRTLSLNRCFDGQICYLHAYDKILSQEEVRELMYKPGSIRDSLQGYWPLYGEVTTDNTDLSGNGNDGTATGTTISDNGPPVFLS